MYCVLIVIVLFVSEELADGHRYRGCYFRDDVNYVSIGNTCDRIDISSSLVTPAMAFMCEYLHTGHGRMEGKRLDLVVANLRTRI